MISDEELRQLQSAVDSTRPYYLADLERLVNVDCGSYTKAGVDEIGGFVASRLRDLGAQVTVQPNEELGNVVVGTFSGAGDK